MIWRTQSKKYYLEIYNLYNSAIKSKELEIYLDGFPYKKALSV